MTNRRRFLQASTAVAFVPITDLISFAKSRAFSFAELELNDFVYDARFVEQDSLNAFHLKGDVMVHAIKGDLTELWSTYLNAAWKESPKTMAGITSVEDLFYLERLAWTHGLRVSFRDVNETMVFIEEKVIDVKLVSWVLEPTFQA